MYFWSNQKYHFWFSMIKDLSFLCYTTTILIIEFSTMNWFDRSEIVIHNIDLIQYHRDAINPVAFAGVKFIISMGLDPELLRNKRRLDYGSQYSRTYCYCTVHSSSYCFFTYHLCKNSQPKWLIWMKLELLLVLIDDLRNERKGFKL